MIKNETLAKLNKLRAWFDVHLTMNKTNNRKGKV